METREMNVMRVKRRIAGCVFLVLLLASGPGFFARAQETVLVVRPEGNDFRIVVKGMAGDLGNDAVIKEKTIDDDSKTSDIDSAVRQCKPAIVVLMDNSAVRLFKKHQRSLTDSAVKVPSIALMGILVGNAIEGLDNAAAISYEIPIVTSALILRSLTGVPLGKVGVVHREIMRTLIERNRETCARENIAIVNRCVQDHDPDQASALKSALIDLLKKEKVDALWIPNDNILLSPSLLKEVWIPIVNKYKKPVIVGIEALASPELNFGTLAVIPDHTALGVQAAALIINTRENNWEVSPGNVDPVLSVYKVLNLKQAQKFFNVKKENISGIDKVLE
jgi:putative ABC transport system substrate-binding protein